MPASYSLGAHYEGLVRQLVDSGRYTTASEVVRDSLRLLEQREEVRAIELENLKRAYAEGKASGPAESVEGASFLKSLKAERSARG